MLQALVIEGAGRPDTLAMKAREERCRTGSVKTIVMVKDAAIHGRTLAFRITCGKIQDIPNGGRG